MNDLFDKYSSFIGGLLHICENIQQIIAASFLMCF